MVGVQGFRVLFLIFGFFCEVWLQQENILFGLLKVSQAHLEVVADSLAGQQVAAWRA
jgi:hypothetical protein